MSTASDHLLRRRAARWIDAYEAKCADSDRHDLRDFLPSPDDAAFTRVLVELVRIQIERSWLSGCGVRLDDLLARFPELRASPTALTEVAFEDYRQRLQAGERVLPCEYAERYQLDISTWQIRESTPSSVLASFLKESPTGECVSDSLAITALATKESFTVPQIGDEFAGFTLLAELGRGAFSTVFLAKQSNLASRYVVLKVSDQFVDESQTLAQLQHTNIVPIYSVHRAGPLHALCMPYLGSATLADTLRELRTHAALPRSGQSLIPTIKAPERATRGPIPIRGNSAGFVEPAMQRFVPPEHVPGHWRRLEQLSYVDAVLWLFARIAAGLEHAHRRGVLHRDLKPANILLRDDGEPMLLDFNLAGDMRQARSASTEVLGGTLPYMAPEQIRALCGTGDMVAAAADIFSLGVMMYEMLSGRAPYSSNPQPTESQLAAEANARTSLPPSIRDFNRDVSPAVDAIVRRCLAGDPHDRYATAGDLQDDLERQLSHLPLRHAVEPSFRERWGKWRRRHPRLCSGASVAVLSAAVLVILGGLLWQSRLHVAKNEAREALAEFVASSLEAQFLLGANDPSSPDRHRGSELARATLSRYRVLEDADWLNGNSISLLDTDDQQRLRVEMADLLLSLADDSLRSGGKDGEAANSDLYEATDLSLRRAAACYDDGAIPRAIWELRVALASKVGDENVRRIASERAHAAPAESPHDRFLLARQAYTQDRLPMAADLAASAARAQPQQVRYWMLQGRIAEARLRYEEAATCYAICAALKPEWSAPLIQRGVCRYWTHDYPSAIADFDEALRCEPRSVPAFVNRALARQQAGKLTEAIADLDRAIELAPSKTRFLYLRARLLRRSGKSDLAQRDEALAGQQPPTDAEGWIARGVNLLPGDPKGALVAFDEALVCDSRSFVALQNKAHVLSEHLREPQRAVEVLDRAIAYYPDFSPALLGRGILLARQGQRELAVADARKALTLDRGASAQYQAACIYAQTSRQRPGDVDDSIHLLFASLHLGFDRRLAARDADLAPIRNHPDFVRLLSNPTPLAESR